MILEGEDAIAFDERMKNPPKPTEELLDMFRRAIKIYKKYEKSLNK